MIAGVLRSEGAKEAFEVCMLEEFLGFSFRWIGWKELGAFIAAENAAKRSTRDPACNILTVTSPRLKCDAPNEPV